MSRRGQACVRRRVSLGAFPWLAAALALALTALLAAQPAQRASAQSPSELVSNFEQDQGGRSHFTGLVGQGFVTGTSRGSYPIDTVEVFIQEESEADAFDVSIWTVDGTGLPQSRVTANFTRPSSFALGYRAFTAPAGTILDSGKSYAVVADLGSNFVWLGTTASSGEDSGGAAGWSLNDRGAWKTDATVPFRLLGNVLRVRINGQSADSLVSNTGQSWAQTTSSARGLSQTFRSGGNYTVSNIQVHSRDSQAFDASIWTVDSDRLPRTKLTDLDPPGRFAPGTLEFSVPGSGLQVGSGGVYAVVFTPKRNRPIFAVTSSDNEDTGAQSNWSIENAFGFLSAGGDWSVSSSGGSLLISVNGYSGKPPGKVAALDARDIAGTSGGVGLRWNAAAAGTGAIIGYRIEVSTDAGSTWSYLAFNTGSTDTSYTDSRAGPYDNVRYRVAAISAIATGTRSDAVSVDPQGFSLVSNLGQTTARNPNFSQNFSQSFQAGGTYTLTSIELAYADSDGDELDASLWTVDGNRLPRSKIRDLVPPDSFVAGTIEFTVPGGGLQVGRGGVYAVVFEPKGTPTNNVRVEVTTSGSEDAGARGGWSLDDRHGGLLFGSWFSSATEALKIAVKGYRGTSPGAVARVEAGDVKGGKVGLQWTPGDAGTEAITGYRIEVSSDAGATWDDLEANTRSTDTSYTDSRAGPYDDLRYRVSAISSIGRGPPSEAVSVDPLGLSLVRNLGQTLTETLNQTAASSQTFVTGGSYTITSIEVGYGDVHGDEFDVSIWNVDADRLPLRKIRDLDPPASFAAGTLEFTVPGGGLQVGRLGVYAVVLEPKGSPTTGVGLYATSSDDQDPGAHRGWSIWDTYGWRTAGGDWSLASVDRALMIGVKGYGGHLPGAVARVEAGDVKGGRVGLQWTPGDAGTEAITGYRIEVSGDAGATWDDLVADTGSADTSYTDTRTGPYDDVRYRVSAISSLGTGPRSDAASVDPLGLRLISNTGQTGSFTSQTGAATGLSQAFSTGSGRFTLRAVEVVTTAANEGFTASLWTTNSNGSPDQKLVDFTIPGGFSDSTVELIPPEHTEIGGSATYAIVLRPADASTDASISGANTGDHDAGGQSGWSIADDHWYETGGAWTRQSAGPLRIAIKGLSDVAPGQPTGLTAQATSRSGFRLSWTAPADTGSTAISGYRIEVSTDGETWTVLEADTGNTVTIYTHSDVPAGAVRHYRVSAVNTAGPGPPSQDASDTADVLVRNGQRATGRDGTYAAGGIATAQMFFAGGDDGVVGYRVDSVDIFYTDDEGDTFTAAIWTADNMTGFPTGAAAVATLVPPDSFSEGRLSFSAPANTRLEVSGWYAIVLTYQGTGTNSSLDLVSTNPGTAGELGWGVNSSSAGRETASSSWTSRSEVFRMAIRGEPLTAVDLVSNTGQEVRGGAGGSRLSLDIAQAFTTGGNSAGDHGFRLTNVDLNLGETNDSVTNATITIHRSNSAGRPGSSIGTLTRADALVDDSLNTWTSSAGIDLAANTTYFIVIEGTGSHFNNPGTLQLTSSDSEDPGAAPGWTIGDTILSKTQSETSWTSASPVGSMAVRGYAKSAAVNNAPVFADTTPTRSIDENSAAGRDVGAAVTATDADTEDTLTYTLGGADAASFEIDSDTGQLSTKTGVTYDFEAKASYTVTVTASDGAASGSATVTINLTDMDEPPDAPDAPALSAVPSSTTSLSMTWTAPTNTGKPDISEYDVRYRQTGTTAWSNGPQDVSGTTTTITGLSAGTSYEAQVRATNDEGDSSWSATSSAGTTNSTTNNTPVFSPTTVTYAIAENTAAGTDIGSAVSATDADTGDTLTYTLGGTDAASFDIDSTDGQLSTKTGITYDFESKETYTVTVTASDGTASATATVTINLTDADEPPAAPAAPTVSAVAGSATSLSVTWAAPSNTGKPEISGYDVRYREGSSGNWSNGPQDVSGTSTTISSLTAGTSYQVQVRASNDEGDSSWSASGSGTTSNAALVSNTGQSLAATTAILGHNHAQAFTTGGNSAGFHGFTVTGIELNLAGTNDLVTSGTIKIHESNSSDEPGTLIGTLTRSAALVDDSVNLWTSSAGIDLAANTTYFMVWAGVGPENNSIGRLRLTDSNSEDPGAASGWTIGNRRLGSTQGYPTWSSPPSSVSMAVRGFAKSASDNNAPVFADTTPTRSIAENTAAGTDIGSPVSATDADTADTLTYTLGGADSASFEIDSDTGQLSTKTGVTYDFEAKETYAVTVSASDGTATATATVTITITDENEPPSAPGTPTVSAVSGSTTSLSVTWTAPTNTGKPDISNYDVRYRQTGTTSWSNGPEDVSGTTTTITGLSAGTSYEAQVRASNDEGDSSWSATSSSGTTNSTTNNTPVFSPTTVTRSFTENTAAGTDIGSPVSATDADTGDTLTYTLGGADAASFAIDSADGQLSTKAGITYDFESKKTYTVTVTASDATASATATVTINLTDAAEPPAAPAAPTVSAVAGSATSLSVTWTAPSNTGPDISGYDVRYREGSSGNWSNGPQNVSGTSTTISSLNAGTAYQVQVRATNDEGDSSWSASGTGTTNSATNSAPTFASATVTRSIAENTAAGTDIGSPVSATDADTADTLTYTLGGADAASFAIDSADGQLSTKTGITYDFESKQTYTVTVTASDNTASATTTVTITITDEDEPPAAPGTPTVSAVSRSSTSLSVTWTAPTNTGKPDISGYDLRYRPGTSGSWSNGPQNVSGTSTTIDSLSAGTSYEVQVRATNDEGDSGWSSSGTGTTNAATNSAPFFADATVTRSLAENTAAGTDIGAAVSATDTDAGDTLTYTLGGADAASFAIDSADGQLSTKTGITYDFESKQTYTVTVTASDATASATATVTINLIDVDEPPSAPGTPTVSAVAGITTSLSVSWTAPTNTGPDISGYDVRYRPGSSGSWSNGPQNVSGTSTTISSLNAGTAYQVQVRATNDEGDSSWSASGSGSTNSATNNAPVFASATVTRSLAENTPAGRNVGAPVSATDADNDTLTYTLGGADAASFTIVSTSGQIRTGTGVSYDYEWKATYTVMVTASDGTASATATVTINLTDVDELPSRPAAPAVRATPGSVTSLSVTWTAPPNTGKPAISGYDLRYRRGSGGDWSDGPQYVGGTSATITGLSPGTTYQVQVRARNHAGDSAWSSSGSGATGRPPVVRVGGRVSGTMSSATDADWFAVDLTAGGHYFLRLRYDGERMDQNGPLQIGGIRDQDGNEIDDRSVDFSCCYQSSGAFGANRTGRFYIPVGVPEWMAPSVSFPLAYTLEVHADEINNHFSPRPPASLAEDPSLAARGAGRAEVGAWTYGAFHDHDWQDRYTVQLCEGQSYRIPLVYNLTAGLDGKVRRPFVSMVRPDGSYETFRDYRDPFAYTATETGPHYVEIFRDGSQPLDALGSLLEPGDMGSGPYRFNVQFVGDGHTGANRLATGSLVVTGTAQVGQTLTVDASGICDTDGATRARFAYQWIRTDGASDTNISGATRASYTLVAADEGKTIKVRVSFTDDRGNAEALTSAATAAVPGPAQNTPGNRAAEGAPTISGTARVGETLSVSTAGISDADGLERARFAYRWLLDGSELGATRQTYTVVEGAVGHTLSVRVTFTDDAGYEESLTSAPTAAVVDSLLEVESATVDGATLKLNYPEFLNTLVDLPETAFTVTVNGTAVTVSDSSVSGKSVTLALASAVAAGDSVTVGYAKPAGYTNVIGDVRGRVAASFSGRAVTNETAPPPLTASARQAPESHDGSSTFTFELHFSEEPDVGYRTLRDHAFTETGGEVTKARRLTAGSNLGWEITVRPSGGGPVTLSLPATADCAAQGAICTGGGKALSAALEVVVPGQGRSQGWLKPLRPARNTPATGAPVIRGTAQVGETLTASTSGIADAEGLSRARFSYRWLADGQAIAGAIASSYRLVASDEGKAITVRVSFSDDAGQAETLTSAPTAAVAPPPLRASVREAPESHDGSAVFTFELHFSEEPQLSYATLRDHALQVTGGEVTKARRLTPGSNLGWEITVRPSSTSAVTVVLPVTTDCGAEGAVCTGGGKRLSERLEIAVPGP